MVNTGSTSSCNPMYRAGGIKSTSTPHDPLGLFSLFFDDTLIGLIVKESNCYAEQVLQGRGKQCSTDVAEIRSYMGGMILMGINQLRFGTTGIQTKHYTTLPQKTK